MKKYFITLFILLLSLGCADKSIKPSADSQVAIDAFNAINLIKEAYESKNEALLRSRMDTFLADNIAKRLLFEKAELTLTPRIVKITESAVRINLNWRGSWWFSNNKRLENRGVADLVFHKETMKLTYIDGDNPFLVPLEK